MTSYWKSKVLPKIKKVFEKDNSKKLAATEACKTFDDSKEEVTKEIEEKKTELQPKVTEIYEASTTTIKTLIKDPKPAGLKKNSTAVQKFLEKLVEIEFPGSKTVCEASSKFGPALIPGPVIFVFEKVSTFIVVEEKEVEAPPPPPAEEGTTSKEKEVVIEEEKKEEVVVVAEPEPAAPAATEPPPKVEEPEATPPKP